MCEPLWPLSVSPNRKCTALPWSTISITDISRCIHVCYILAVCDLGHGYTKYWSSLRWRREVAVYLKLKLAWSSINSPWTRMEVNIIVYGQQKKKKMPLELEEIKRKVKKLQHLTEQNKQTNRSSNRWTMRPGGGFTSDRVLPTKSRLNQEPRNSIREPLMRAKHHLVSETCTAPGRSRCHRYLMNPNIRFLFFFSRSLTEKKQHIWPNAFRYQALISAHVRPSHRTYRHLTAFYLTGGRVIAPRCSHGPLMRPLNATLFLRRGRSRRWLQKKNKNKKMCSCMHSAACRRYCNTTQLHLTETVGVGKESRCLLRCLPFIWMWFNCVALGRRRNSKLRNSDSEHTCTDSARLCPSGVHM